MAWIVRLVRLGAEGEEHSTDVLQIARPDDLTDLARFGADPGRRQAAPGRRPAGGTTVLTAFTDGCSGLRRILFDAGVDGPPILDWFHLAMRLQHLTRIAGSLSSDNPERAAAKAVIVEEAERLRWRLWNDKAKNAGISIDRICAVMHYLRDEPGGRRSIAPSRKLWTALQVLNNYLTSQSGWLIDYAERHRAGLRVGTALTEGTANFLVNRRMNKSQQMRWTRRGADRLSRSAVRSTTARSAPASASVSRPPTTGTWQQPSQPDPQLCDSPKISVAGNLDRAE